MHARPVICDSDSDYVRVAASATRDARSIPIYGRPFTLGRGWNASLPALTPADVTTGADDASFTAGTLRDQVNAVYQAARSAARATNVAALPGAVIVPETTSAIAGALLAGQLGMRLVMSDEKLDLTGPLAGAVFVVRTRDEATDDVLFAVLDDVRLRVAGDAPWHALPRHAIVTGRDFAALTWSVAKILASSSLEVPRGPSRVAHFSSRGPSARVTETCGNEPPRVRDERDGELLATLRRPLHAAVYETHGSDGCANAGSGVVLCGLRAEGLVAAPGAKGTLACGHAHACPRGPSPLPLRQVPSEILALASCNGVRLAGSMIGADYNLALAYLDGPGLAYVSAVAGTVGNEATSRILAAALAAGRTVGEATLLVNAFLVHASVDQPVYLALGASEHTITAPPREVAELSATGPTLTVDGGDATMAEVVIVSASVARLARERRLCLDIAGASEVLWFVRPESDDRVRAFFFGFPTHLGVLEVAVRERQVVEDDVARALAGSARMRELAELLAVPAPDAEERQVQRAFVRTQLGMGFNGGAAAELRALAGAARALASQTRAAIFAEVVPKLAGPFWLTNVLSADYHFERGAAVPCQNCRGPAIERTLRHPTTREARIVVDCPHCTIVSDVMERGMIESLALEAADVVLPGATLDIRLRVSSRRAGPTGVTLVARFSARSRGEAFPAPESLTAILEPGQSEYPFRLTIPDDFVPHYYFLKALVATDEEIAFANRIVLVGAKDLAQP